MRRKIKILLTENKILREHCRITGLAMKALRRRTRKNGTEKFQLTIK